MDLSRANIEYCKQHWPRGTHTSMQFLQGDSEHLSMFVPRLSVDYIVDIEGFFYLQDKHGFFREAHNVLKEDGRLFMGFFIQRTRLEEIHGYIRQYFDILKEDDITENALHSLRLDSQKISRYADQHYSFGMNMVFK
jgi:ubiquinone/menaquinone biosynthesis C-methylase UbiE